MTVDLRKSERVARPLIQLANINTANTMCVDVGSGS